MALFDIPKKGKKPKEKKKAPKKTLFDVKKQKTKAVSNSQTGDKKTDNILSLIKRRRLQMLIHSCIYYRLGQNLITDKQFDTWGEELAKLQKDNPELSKEVVWAEAFENWDASTGFHLPTYDQWVLRKAKYLVKINKRRR